MAIKKTLIA